MTNNILLYHLDNETAYGENSTTVNDFSSQNNDGIVGEAGWTTSGKLDGAYDFDNTEEIQRRKAISAIRNSKLSSEIEIWARELRDEAFVEILPYN